MYLHKSSDKISISDSTVIYSPSYLTDALTDRKYAIDNYGKLWFLLPYEKEYKLFSWYEGTEREFDLGLTLSGDSAFIAVNNSEVNLIFQDEPHYSYWDNCNKATYLVSYDKWRTVNVDTLTLPSGEFQIKDMFYLNATLYVTMKGWNASIKSKTNNTDSIIFIGSSYVLASIVNGEFYFKNEIYQIDDYRISGSSPEFYYSFDSYNSFRLITADWIGTMHCNYKLSGCFFAVQDKLFLYSNSSGKIVRLDNLAGLKYASLNDSNSVLDDWRY